MAEEREQLVASVHRSVHLVIRIFKLLRAPPPAVQAHSLLDYSGLLEQMLLELYQQLPKLCVPLVLFKQLEAQTMEVNQVAQNYLKEHRSTLVELRLLQDRLKAAEHREKLLTDEKNQALRSLSRQKKRTEALRKNGEQQVKQLLEAGLSRAKPESRSLPQLQSRDKLALLFLMAPSRRSQRLPPQLVS